METIKQLQERNNYLEGVFANLTTSSKAEIATLQNELEEARAQIESLTEQLASANAETKEAEQALKDAQDKVTELKVAYDAAYEAYEGTLAAAIERYFELERLNGELVKANGEIEKANKEVADFANNIEEVLDESIFDEILSK